jgi:hypothetical protein
VDIQKNWRAIETAQRFSMAHSANPGLNVNQLLLFIYFCMMICFQTLENKTSIEPKKISGKTARFNLIDELLVNLICKFVLTQG